LEVGSGNAEVGMTGKRKRKKVRSWEGEKVRRIGSRKWDPSSSKKNGTMPRQGCGMRKVESGK